MRENEHQLFDKIQHNVGSCRCCVESCQREGWMGNEGWSLTGEFLSPSALLHSKVAPHKSIIVPSLRTFVSAWHGNPWKYTIKHQLWITYLPIMMVLGISWVNQTMASVVYCSKTVEFVNDTRACIVYKKPAVARFIIIPWCDELYYNQTIQSNTSLLIGVK